MLPSYVLLLLCYLDNDLLIIIYIYNKYIIQYYTTETLSAGGSK